MINGAQRRYASFLSLDCRCCRSMSVLRDQPSLLSTLGIPAAYPLGSMTEGPVVSRSFRMVMGPSLGLLTLAGGYPGWGSDLTI